MGTSLTTEQAQARLAWFLAGAYPGASKRKRIARDFAVSPDTAKGWLNGYAWPRQETFLQMRAKWGADFIRFIYIEMDELDARIARLEKELNIENTRAVALVSVEAPGAPAKPVREGGSVGGENETEATAVRSRA